MEIKSQYRNVILDQIEKHGMEKADLIIAVSNFTKEKVTKLAG